MARERGSGVTPPRVVELLKNEVSEKSILAVSNATGLGLAAIGRYLKGVGEPTTASLKKLADYFKVSVQWLRGEPVWETYEQARTFYDFSLLPDEKQKRFLEQFINETDEIAAERALETEKIKLFFEKYRDLITIFLHLPAEDRDNAIDVLRIVQKEIADNPFI